MNVSAENFKYEWIDNWAQLPTNQSSVANGRTHAVQVTASGEIVVFAQCDPAVNFYDAHGTLLRSWGDRFGGAHSLTLVSDEGVEYLWLTDEGSGEVVKTTLDGSTVLSIEKPAVPQYEAGRYVPTWVAVNEERYGGNGDVWVADGYGSSLVHRFDKRGKYISTLDGTTGEGRFNCPHGIFVDYRSGQPKLYVADRGNHRVQVFDGDGVFVKTFGTDFLTSPDCFSVHDGILLIPELFGRVALVDANDQLIGYLGQNDNAPNLPGWPNVQPADLEVGRFNSPHGGTFDADGNVYIVEWIVGGRITKLARIQ